MHLKNFMRTFNLYFVCCAVGIKPIFQQQCIKTVILITPQFLCYWKIKSIITIKHSILHSSLLVLILISRGFVLPYSVKVSLLTPYDSFSKTVKESAYSTLFIQCLFLWLKPSMHFQMFCYK